MRWCGERSALRLVSVLLAVAGTWSTARGHGSLAPPPPTPPSTPPAPKPPGSPADVDIIYLYPPRWSWVHWWEANRDSYLETIRQGRSQQAADRQARERFGKQAAEALLAATKDKDWRVRASAALALGRMGHAEAFEALKALATGDASQSVRVFALVGIGLLNGPASEKFLLTTQYPTTEQREAALVAIGLLKTVTSDAVAGLQKTLKSGAVGPATVAAWALRHRKDPATAALLQGVLSKDTNPWLASESLLALGRPGQTRGVALLSNVLLASRSASTLRAWRRLATRHAGLVLAANSARNSRVGYTMEQYNKAYQTYLQQYEQWRKTSPNPLPPARKRGGAFPVHVVVGVERIYLSRLRASAAIALGQIDHAASRRSLLKCLSQGDDEYSELHKGLAMISLGQLGDERAVTGLLATLSPVGRGGTRKTENALNTPLRGYAAIALGLYSRAGKTPQGPVNRRGFEKVCRLLAERVADRRETLEVRSAAAMALGLTARTANLKYLQKASQTVAARDDPLVGYMLLARAMLGDRTIVTPAGRFLNVANDRTDPSGILSRRAGVLALGVLGSREAVPMLTAAWRLNYYANREVAVALSLLQSYGVTEPLVKLLGESDNVLERAFAARCLGETFTATRPPRLSRLIAGGNYTVKNKRMVRFQAMANEFLFAYLIPAFGDNWR